jgi:hypothetical protein
MALRMRWDWAQVIPAFVVGSNIYKRILIKNQKSRLWPLLSSTRSLFFIFDLLG